MFNFLKTHRGKSAASATKLPRSVIAHFRAAESSPAIPEWWKADNLPVDIDALPDVRRRLRMRSRYEVQNNSYARGIVQTLAKDSIGSGSRLRFGSNDDMFNAAHVQTINLQNKTTTLATEYARQGKNWKTELEQIKKEQQYPKELGLS